MIGIWIDFIASIAGGVIAAAIYDTIKNKKNNRPEPDKRDDNASDSLRNIIETPGLTVLQFCIGVASFYRRVFVEQIFDG